MKNIKVIVATHKKYEMPSDKMYLPIHVGAKNKDKIGYETDDKWENISIKNPYFCELTGLYWAWKNLNAKYIGLAHYRRHFASKKINKKDLFNSVLTKKEADKLFDDVDIIVPQKRKYYIETLYSHYEHTMYVEPLDITGKIIEEKYPEYMKEFNKLKKRTSSHMFNMFIMKKEHLNKYCEWMFNILFELEKRIDPKQYDSFHARYLGRISELLLDIWINTNKLNYEEIKVIDMQNVNWFKKGSAFLMAKFTGKKYGKSF